MRFTPKSEEEITREGLLPDGEYPFSVLEAEDATSKNGNDMIKVKLAVYPPEGNARHIYDYLMEAMAYKLRHFCVSAGIEDKYNDGTICADDCARREGYVRIRTVPAKDGYDPKNEVKDYVVPKEGAPKADPRLKNPNAGLGGGSSLDDEDSVPF